jgi:signal peptidase II
MASAECQIKNKYVWVASIITVILVLDQVSKYFVEKHLRLYEIVTVIPGFFNLTHVRNKGAALGILSGLPGVWRSLFFVAFTLIALVVIASVLRKTHERLLVASFSLIMGGAIGNVIDRIRYGEVVDFIQWYVKTWYWPSFNVADSAISIGVALLAIDMLFRKDSKTADAS